MDRAFAAVVFPQYVFDTQAGNAKRRKIDADVVATGGFANGADLVAHVTIGIRRARSKIKRLGQAANVGGVIQA